MTDINFTQETTVSNGKPNPCDVTSFIELLFFAYRDFVSDPDVILQEYGFGRAHHRVVHFIARNPGISVAELLDILQITKQSLARVLKQLIETGFIRQEQGAQDRRQRLLFTTQKGEQLFDRLMEPQSRRIKQALHQMNADEQMIAERFLSLLINEDERELAKRMSKKIKSKVSL
ncbi:MAG: MarR family transcriptional regulator [Hyphomicrobiales bacterium]|nr:MarR family transcriptional regulator [Hyphomicrobiales bacterium]PCJ82850.1 MAG: MarR family transcriptional regulator [Hyphomicrobiales bacterium]